MSEINSTVFLHLYRLCLFIVINKLGVSDMKLADILVVEDCAFDIEIIKGLMKADHMKFNLHTAVNGQDALDFLNSDKNPGIDFILLDINMLFMDGFSFLEYKQEHAVPDCPVVVCTSSTYDEDMDKAYLLGATDYIEKPPSIDKIKNFIGKIKTVYLDENDNEFRILQAA